ncbi:hypothetical protein ACRS8P_32565 [Burkholderia cenocepacia]
MPIDFDKLPPEVPEPDKPPSRLVWTIVFFVVVCASVFAVLLLWPKSDSTRSIWFWICVTVYPIGVAAFVVLRRYSVFEGHRLDAIAWNEARERYVNAVFEQASRPLAVVAATYRFSSEAKDDAFDKLLNGATKLEPRTAPKPDAPPVSARWFDEPGVDDNGNRFRSDDERQRHVREWVFGALIDDIAESVRVLPSDLKLTIHLILPSLVNTNEALESWERQWAKSDLRALGAEIQPKPPDLMTLDKWLDRINENRDQEARLLVFVRLNHVLQALPSEGSAEAGVALLIAPEPVQRKFKIEPIAWLHRPNGSAKCPADVALVRALRWGRTEPAIIRRVWQSGLDSAVRNEVTSAIVKAGIVAKPVDIGYMVGHAGEAEPWLGVTCAAKAAAHDGSTQLLVTANENQPCFTIFRNIDTQ